MKRERERKEQESKKNQKVEFVSGSSQPGAVLTAPKVGLPIAGGFFFFGGKYLLMSVFLVQDLVMVFLY